MRPIFASCATLAFDVRTDLDRGVANLNLVLENHPASQLGAHLVNIDLGESWQHVVYEVADLPRSFPRNDKQIDTDAGDIILYQGNSITIYYDKNSWNFTRLARIDNVNKKRLQQILGKGNVKATFSVE